jgi:hypothetical protein
VSQVRILPGAHTASTNISSVGLPWLAGCLRCSAGRFSAAAVMVGRSAGRETVMVASSLRYPRSIGERDRARTGRIAQLQVAEWSHRRRYSAGPLASCATMTGMSSSPYSDSPGLSMPRTETGTETGNVRVLAPRSLTMNDFSPVRCVHGRTQGVDVYFPRSLLPPRLPLRRDGRAPSPR